VGTEGRPSTSDRLLEAFLWLLPRLISLPLLVVLALFRALRFERGLTWLRRGGVGLFYFVDTAWLVGIVALLFMLVFGRRAYGVGIVVGLFLFVLMHSGIAHSADYYAGHDPAEEFIKQSKERKDGGSNGDGLA
jgi:hypothetical protein